MDTGTGLVCGSAAIADSNAGVASRTGTLPPVSLLFRAKPNYSVYIPLKEREILTTPCFCLCCYEVAATVVEPAPGEYTVEFCWYDYEAGAEQCYTDNIVAP